LTTVPAVQKRSLAFSLKVWFLETRPQFLLLPLVLILLGTAAAWYEGSVNVVYAIIALIGLLLCHSSVNILNDYCDFVSGVDLKTLKTPFSGGSGILPASLLRPKQVLWYGLVCLILAIPIGIYFTLVQGWQLLPLIIVAALCIILYTPVILKGHFPEWTAGLGLGFLPVLGAYFVQTGHYSWPAFFVSVPPGFLVLNLLLLNEFPDAEADAIASKKTLPITAGKKGAAVAYTSFALMTYVWIIGAAAGGQIPKMALIALLTLPFALKAIRGSFSYNKLNILLPALGSNVLMVLGIPLLMGIGYILATIFPFLR
jgi:1,4-dihydroxy-2-naphthoate octaprenyltransferase